VCKIVSVPSGKVLDVREAAGDDGAQILQYTDHDGTNQWQLEPVSHGVYKIVSAASGKVLDVPGAAGDDGVGIQQYTYKAATNQWWLFVLAAAVIKSTHLHDYYRRAHCSAICSVLRNRS
jgi:hypothetical protein